MLYSTEWLRNALTDADKHDSWRKYDTTGWWWIDAASCSLMATALSDKQKVIDPAVVAQFSQKVDSYGFAND
jgi:hypothetical protein